MMGGAPTEIAPRAYADLVLELRDMDPQTEVFTVNLSGATVGELEPAGVSLSYTEIDQALLELEDGGIEEEEDLITLGKALADRLLPEGQMRDRVGEALRGTGPDGGIRLRLLIREPRLAQIPWEYTYLPWHDHEGSSDFLVLDPKVSMVRHEALPVQYPSVAPRDARRLRLVGVTANSPGYQPLDLQKERRVIERALKDLPLDSAKIDYEPLLVDSSVEEVQAALLQGADIFHFAGHGGFDQGAGFIVLPDEPGTRADILPADKLALLLRQAGVRVAMLGACESGRREGESPWAGVAPALVGRDVPAVVAMQYKVLDSSAIKFARAFYTAIAAGLSIDEAVSAGRLAVYDPDDLAASWGIPALYMRAPDGVVFSHLTDQPSATADSFRTVVRQVIQTVEETGKAVGIKVLRGGGSATIEVNQEVGVVKGVLTGIEELDLSRPQRRAPDNAD
jgi:hypothetical protein